jgi:membrane-associated phospholipid phosphatase
VLKPLIDRTLMGAPSFPSGHATGVFTLAAVFAVLLINPPRARLGRGLRTLLAMCGILTAAAVAVALVNLDLHYATDTLGGAAMGTAVVLLAALILDRCRRPPRGVGYR